MLPLAFASKVAPRENLDFLTVFSISCALRKRAQRIFNHLRTLGRSQCELKFIIFSRFRTLGQKHRGLGVLPINETLEVFSSYRERKMSRSPVARSRGKAPSAPCSFERSRRIPGRA